ncbi:conjugal transfer protein TraR [Sphingomonas sp. 3-13AW]|uniref:conjugal transfer protein TraR n=1 Tax=Sphingomonas sp. 3-13AW TaxID=3050450 RepID=UPI003BB5ED5C
MADEVDAAQVIQERHLALSIAAARAPAPEGQPGECDECGYDRPRLVRGRCAFCRDGRSPHG